jgi:hypothetical protein
MCAVSPTRYEVRDASGKVHATMDVPTGFEIREVPSPWYVRLWWGFRRGWFRAWLAVGAR